jgi:hypothetical protein
MQHVINSPRVTLQPSQEGQQNFTRLFQTPTAYHNSMILTTSRFSPNLGTNHALPSIEWNYQEFDEIYNNSSHNTYEISEWTTIEDLYELKNTHFKSQGKSSSFTNGDEQPAIYTNNEQEISLCIQDQHMDKENGTAQETVEEIQIQQTEQHETMPESNETSNSEPNSREELNEEDIDNFLRNDEDGNTQIDKKHIPELGMKFKTDKEAHGFFNFYAYLAGFSTVITHHYKSTSKKRNGEITKYTYR